MTLFGTFLNPPSPSVWHFFIFDNLFLGLNCFKILKELARKYLLKPYLALWQKVFLPKALKTVFTKAKKYVWHFVERPSKCHVLLNWGTTNIKKNTFYRNTYIFSLCLSCCCSNEIQSNSVITITVITNTRL